MTASEYLPSSKENGNGNGHANGSDKKFGIVPMQDENLASIAPRLRYQVQTDAGVPDGAKVLYCFLSDQSFLNSVSPSRGVVTMSKLKLAEHLKVSSRTIARNGRALESKRFVWTRIFWRGGFELTNWYLRGLADSQTEMFDNADPSWGRTRIHGLRSRQTARGSNGQFCPHGGPQPETADLLEKSRVNGQQRPRATVKIDRCQRTVASVVNGQQRPLSTDTSVRGHGTVASVDNGHLRPLTTDNPDRGQRTAVSELEDSPVVKEHGESPLNVQRAERLSRKTGENEFLAEVKETMAMHDRNWAVAEMAGSGGCYRKYFRENPTKARTVLADTRCAIKEHRIKKNPGAHFMDLWGRLP
jgi:hypothetical protein